MAAALSPPYRRAFCRFKDYDIILPAHQFSSRRLPHEYNLIVDKLNAKRVTGLF